MAGYNTILFDLDGTLTDPTLEMVRSAQHALQHFGIEEHDTEKLLIFTRKPLLQCFEEDYGLSRQQADMAFNHYWQYATTFGVQLNNPYIGVPELIRALHERGKTLCVATARQTRNAEQILKANHFDRLFTHVLGTTEDDVRRSKRMVIFDLICCELPETSPGEIIMVGDRVTDVIAARDNGIDSMAATFGQEPEEEVLAEGPTYVARTPEEMARQLLDLCP